jgi:hemerythrin-like domain-containing protein
MQKWKELIDVHLKKMNKIVNNSYVFPNDVIDQLVVFNNQMKKHINLDQTVAVLSAFPVFLHDYYGNEGIKKRLE